MSLLSMTLVAIGIGLTLTPVSARWIYDKPTDDMTFLIGFMMASPLIIVGFYLKLVEIQKKITKESNV